MMKNEELRFQKYIKDVPMEYRANILSSLNSIQGVYPVFVHEMPAPVWKKRRFEDIGKAVWDKIQQNVKYGGKAISIYIHIPFCKGEKCGFCDCLSTSMNKDTPVLNFVEKLTREIRLWSNIPGINQKPVSIIYFGGGTPNSLPDRAFRLIFKELREGFNVHDRTQISVECPGKLMTDGRMEFLKSLNVSRISTGIQTLEEPLRQKIGCDISSNSALRRIRKWKAKGFVIGADVIYGLPEQTIVSLISTLKRIANTDIDGLSLYRFVVSIRNRGFVNHTFPGFEKDEVYDYILFHIGHKILIDSGYHKNHFIHFAKNDDNLYYRHMLRGEDLVAIGPTADGLIGNYRYRQPHLKEYLGVEHLEHPIFEGGMQEPVAEVKVRKASVEIMCNSIRKETFRDFGIEDLFQKWKSNKLIEKVNGDYHGLTANGSWLIDQLIHELHSAENGSCSK